MSFAQDKNLVKFQKALSEQQYYEAHQFLRMIVNRHVKQEQYEHSVNLLYTAAKQLLEAGQQASGSDLALYMVHVYTLMNQPPNGTSKARLFDLLRLYGPDTSLRQPLIREALTWSRRWAKTPAGDPDLHHGIGFIWAQEGNLFEAEKHLVLGTRQSLEPLMNLLYTYFDQDTLDTAPFYTSRVVFPYLMVQNMAGAVQAYRGMSRRLVEVLHVPTQTFSSSAADVVLFPSLPLMNFLCFLLLTCQRGVADLFHHLTSHYASALQQAPAWQPSLDKIADLYFHLTPTQSTPAWADWMHQWLNPDDSTLACDTLD